MCQCIERACVQLLSQVLKTVKALHGSGYAHRNIKPSNILQRHKHHDWILADLACAAPLGMLLCLCAEASVFQTPC
jgi:serine/threonine protein kinase